MLKIRLFLFLAIFSTSGFTVFAQTNDWRQFSSTIAGYAVKYPEEWRGKEEIYGNIWRAFFISPGVWDDDVIMTSGIYVCSQPKGFVSTSSDSRSSCRQRDDHLSEYAKDKVVSEETLEINGIKIRKKITENKYRPDATYIYAFFSTKDRDILIGSIFPRRFNLDKYISVFDQMLSTLQIVEKDSVINYRNEKYGFSLSFSGEWRSCPADGYSIKKEEIINLAPKDEGCLGANYISISVASEPLKSLKPSDIRKVLRDQNYTEIIPSLELNELQTISGEKTEGRYLYRQRYFASARPEPSALLKIIEMYDTKKEHPQNEAQNILATVKKINK